MKNLLITGGAGFIPSNFIKYILNKYENYNIVNLDLLTYSGNLENLIDIDNRKYQFIKGDITDKNLVDKLFLDYKFDYVIHFAAETHVDKSINYPEIFVKTNVVGTQILLDISKKYWQRGADKLGYPIYKDGVKYIQVSTDEVYGDLPGKYGFTENSPLAPSNIYSAAKASGDMFVSAYYKTFHFPMNITRCSNNYGPYQFPEKLIPLVITNAFNGKSIPVYGDGMQIRDWIHVNDHCRAIDFVLHDGKIGEVYNIGGNSERTNIEVVKLILKKLNKSESLIEYVKDRLGHDRNYKINYNKIRKELNWEPVYNFEDGIRETINWYINNKKWLKNLKGDINDSF